MDVPSYILGKSRGGGGGTSDYSALSNKPSINSVELSGNKTTADLGLQEVFVIDENSNSKPFILDGKKKGIYVFKNSGITYYKVTATSDTRQWSGVGVITFNLLSDYNYNGAENIPCMIYFTEYGEYKVCDELGIMTNGFALFNATSSIGKFLSSSAQSISGVKTFNSIPKQSNTTAPTDNTEFTNKKYVDDKVATVGFKNLKINLTNAWQLSVNAENTEILQNAGEAVMAGDFFNFELVYPNNGYYMKLLKYEKSQYSIKYTFMLPTEDAVGQYEELLQSSLYIITVNYAEQDNETITGYYLTKKEAYFALKEYEPYTG